MNEEDCKDQLTTGPSKASGLLRMAREFALSVFESIGAFPKIAPACFASMSDKTDVVSF